MSVVVSVVVSMVSPDLSLSSSASLIIPNSPCDIEYEILRGRFGRERSQFLVKVPAAPPVRVVGESTARQTGVVRLSLVTLRVDHLPSPDWRSDLD